MVLVEAVHKHATYVLIEFVVAKIEAQEAFVLHQG